MQGEKLQCKMRYGKVRHGKASGGKARWGEVSERVSQCMSEWASRAQLIKLGSYDFDTIPDIQLKWQPGISEERTLVITLSITVISVNDVTPGIHA